MAKRALIIVIALVSMLLARGAECAEITMDAIVDKKSVTIGEDIYLSVSVKGIASTGTPPNVSGGGAFDVSYRGSGSKFTMINGRTSSSVDFNYLLTPKRTGMLTLPAVTYNYDGKVYSAPPIKIMVKKEKVNNSSAQDVFVMASVTNSSPYVNEQIIYSFKLYSKVSIARPSYDPPNFENFYYEELGNSSRYQEIVNGQRYSVNEVRYALFPLKSGEYGIPSVRTKLDVIKNTRRRDRYGLFGGYNEYKTMRLNTNEVKLTVKPLPSYNVKDVPFTNLVGDFKMSSSLGKTSLNVNDSTTLTINIYGYGNIREAVLPADHSLSEFKTFDDKPSDNVKIRKDGLYGTKTFKRAFIPLKEGRLTMPPVRFTYFDPQKGDYVVLSTPEYLLDVKPSAEAENLNFVRMGGSSNSKESVKLLGMDILPIKTSIELVASRRFDLSYFLAAAILLPPWLIYVALVVQARVKEIHDADGTILKRRRALKDFTRAIHRLTSGLSDDNDSFYAGLLGAFKEYVGNKFDLVGGALTTKELNAILSAREIPADLVNSVSDSVSKLERAQFATQKYTLEEKRALLKTLTLAVKKIEKRVK